MKKQSYQKLSQWLCGALGILMCSAQVQAGHVSYYGIAKKQVYRQTSDSAVAPAADDGYAAGAFAVPTTDDSIVVAMLTPPTGTFIPPLEFTGAGLAVESTYASQAALDAAFPPGQYTFTIVSSDFMSSEGPATLTIAAGAYPNTPQVSNFTAAQAVDPAKAFVVNWNAFEGATANDFVQLTVKDEFGDILFQTGFPGQPGALPGNARSGSIPADMLNSDSTHTVLVGFHRVGSRNTTDYAGGIGVTTYAKETGLTLETTGDSGEDPGDPNELPAILLTSNPFNGSKNIGLNSPVTFSFSVPMAAAQSITWSPNVTPSKFTCTWGAEGRTLTCTYGDKFPANALISWTLDPATFKDRAGNPLLPFNNSGSFTTGTSDSDPTDPCNGGGPIDTGLGAFSLFKNIQYIQTSASAPLIDPEAGATFGAALKSPSTNPVTQASLQLPNGTTKPLTSTFGNFMLFEEFPSEAALDAAYPAGRYILTMTRAAGTATMTLQLAASAPPTPQVANFAQTQSFDPTADFNLQWLAFTGAAANDGIDLSLYDGAGKDFHAPDPCVPRPLANTDTSIVIPRNTFGSGQVEGSLQFSRVSTLDTNSVPGISGYAGYSKNTAFKLQGSGGNPPSQPQIQNLVRQQNGSVQFQVKANAGANLAVEASSDLKAWLPLTTAPAPSGLLEVSDPQAVSMKYRFYRARAL